MKIIIARHGDAEEASSGGSDRDRALSEKGRNDIIRMCRFIEHSPVKVDKIFYSPYLRTRMTADTYYKNLQVTHPPESYDCLAPGNYCQDILPDLARFSNSETVMIVAHNPEVSQFTASLLGIPFNEESLIFTPGTTACLLIPKETFKKGKLIWFVAPDMI